MATVNDVVIPNVAKDTGGQFDGWHGIWATTRAMKKAGWKVLASTDGTTKTVSDDPELDKWDTGTVTNAGASAASTGAISGGRMTVTGLTGVVAADKGRFLHLSGASSAGNNHWHQIEEVVSATEVRVDARRSAFTPVASDANNGSITWEIVDPTTGSRAALDTTAAWIVMSGPSTVKVPITAAPAAGPTGFTFIRGENVSQATTGAEGEVLGFVFDASANSGYLVVSPRVIGSGGDPFGWATSNTVTGATSGATVGQDGTALEYRQQVVFRKNSNENDGHMYVQCVDPVNESADSFETLASSAGADATTQPGGGGTGNAFPTIGYVNCGKADQTPGSNWGGSTNGVVTTAAAQCVAADAIFEKDYSADGSFAMCLAFQATSSTATGGVYGGRALLRMEDTEPGDLDPFVGLGFAVETLYGSAARTSASSTLSSSQDPDVMSHGIQDQQTTAIVFWRGWRRRGLGTDDDFITLEQAAPAAIQSGGFTITNNPSDFYGVATEPVTTVAREPVELWCQATNQKMRKGSVKRITMVQNGQPNKTYDDGRSLCLHNVDGAYVISIWDGTSIPRSV